MAKITIIGAGPGGYDTAVYAAGKGLDVTIITDGPVGGTCLNEGCIPTKCFCRNAEVLEELRRGSEFGVEDLSYKFDFGKVLSRKEEVVGQLRKGVEFLLGGKGITLVHGKASLKDEHTVLVDGQEITSDYIIIATGSYSATLPIPGKDLEGVLTSREMLDIPEVPKRLVVIGAGVIGLELASVFRSFGSEVSVVEFCPTILPRFDVDLAKRLRQALVKRGISIALSAQVQSITREGDSLKVNYLQKDKELFAEGDKVLMAVGRRANMGSLNLADLGIECSKRGVTVDGNMRTNVPNVYAVGDVTGGIMLAHVATFQGYRAVNDILVREGMASALPDGRVDGIDLGIVPAAVFTNPEAATVGLTEEECKDRGIAYKAVKANFRANGKALSLGEPDGYCKVLYCAAPSTDSATGTAVPEGRILGCHLFGAHASDIIQEVTALMNARASMSDFASVIHAHPTLGEVLSAAARS